MNYAPNVHPERDKLSAFVLGDLPEDEAKHVEVHISECDTCCETLLNLENDTFADLVVRAKDIQIQPDETEHISGVSEGDDDFERAGDLVLQLSDHPKYRTAELLGRGGMGDVFKAEHKMMERTVALKAIKRELFRKPSAIERFHREVKSAAKLSHPNIVTAYDAEQAGDVTFLVMEYVEGFDLAHKVRTEGPLSISEASDYIRQAARGLQHAHERGMVHRDIKPHNLMVTREGTVKILDFGLATLATEAITSDSSGEPAHDNSEKSSSRLTTLGTMMGTPDFISPEQASEPHRVDIRSDIYSLGCTFYYLLTGRPPFTEGTAMERVKAHHEVQPVPIEDMRSDISPQLADVVRRMMSKDPDERCQTPAEVADALAPFVDAYRTVPAEEKRTNLGKSATRSQVSWWPPAVAQWLLLGAFAFILGTVIYLATDGGTLVVDSEDDSIEVTIRPVDAEQQENEDDSELRITDTLTGSTVRWLRSGEYKLALKSDTNAFELSRDHFVLKRGKRVVVTVKKRQDRVALDTGPRVRPVSNVNSSGEPSHDERFFTATDWQTGDVAFIELASGKLNRLTNDGSWHYPHGSSYNHVWSPDGERIAYDWFIGKDNVWTTELRVVGRDGSDAKLVYRNEDHSDLKPFQWSRDGTSVLVAYKTPDKKTELALISVDNGAANVLKSLKGSWPINASISPDGKYVVYDAPQEATSRERNIHVIVTDSKQDTLLVEHPDHDYAPEWTPDGHRIVFTSNRNGSTKLWVLRVQDGLAAGSPEEVETVDMHRMAPLGFSQSGNYFYGSTVAPYASGDIYLATLDLAAGKKTSGPSILARQHEGLNTCPFWSRDGEYLAYASPRGPLTSTQGTQDFVIRSFATGQEEIVTPNINWGTRSTPQWSPNGRSFYVIGKGDEGRGIYVIEKDSGNERFIAKVGGRHPQAVLSHDGGAIYYTRGAQIVERDLTSGKEKTVCTWREYPSPQKAIHSLAVSPDGSKLAFADLDTLAMVPTIGGRPEVVIDVERTADKRIPTQVGIAWTPDGKSLIFATGPSFVGAQRLWRIAIGADEPQDLGLDQEEVEDFRHIALSPDGQYLLFTGRARQEIPGPIWALKDFLPPLAEANSPNR